MRTSAKAHIARAAEAILSGRPAAAQDMAAVYKSRIERLAAQMAHEGIFAAIFEDTEGRRSAHVRYLCGHPGDALLAVTADGRSILCPWDVNLAAQHAHAGRIIASAKYDRDYIKAAKAILKSLKPPRNQFNKVEVPPSTPYPLFLEYVDALSGFEVRCTERSIHDFVSTMRSIKDEYEIACVRRAAQITCAITDEIESLLRGGKISTEADVALLIERRLRENGCERTGFDTLAAGPGRSFAIHAFPGYTDGPWGTQGLSILDYGLVCGGYTSDATLTIARGPLSAEQEELLDLVEKAAGAGLGLYKKGVPLKDAAAAVDAIFSEKGRSMPHSLGHGIGLDIHEAPLVRTRAKTGQRFEPGMIVTLEPGLYDPALGGARLENDVLITEDGSEPLTNSRIIRL